ncbi:MAG: methyltransferase domain-containing protein [Pseudomonadota bacterium]
MADRIRHAPEDLARRYGAAASVWGDKMRALGYFDAYCGFLAATAPHAPSGIRVLDIGAGTAAFAEAWLTTVASDTAMTLLDPSPEMLAAGAARLAARGVAADTAQVMLEDYAARAPFDVLLAAHVLEHDPDPAQMLRTMRNLVRPGGRLWLVVSKPHWCNAIVWLQWRHRSYRPETVRTLLATSGWHLTAEHAFRSGPPSRTSRGYLVEAR